MTDTLRSDGDQERTADQSMAVSSPSSPQKSKRSTPEISRDDRLEIIGKALDQYRAVGGEVRVTHLFDTGTRLLIIILPGAELVDNRIVAINGN